MSALGLGAILSGGASLLQGIIGGIQASRANKKLNQLQANRPQYQIPKEYEDILNQYKMSYASDMPGYAQTLSNIGQAGARARGAAERGAISSNAYGAQVSDLYQKELDALQNLGIQQEQYKASQLDKMAQAQSALGAQKSEQWNLNQFVPWQTEMNRYSEQKSTGMQNLFSGIQGGLGVASDFLGTKYYADTLKGLYQQGSGGSGTVPFFGWQSPALSTPNPQQSLLDTTKKLMGGIQINYPK